MPCSWIADTRSPRSYGTSARTSIAGSGRASSMAVRSSSMPSPVRDEAKIAFGSRPRSSSRVSSSTRSALLNTTSSGMSRAPTSPITSRTVASWAAGSGCEPSTTCTMTSGVADLLERRAERLHQLVGQVPHEADRVGERVDAAVARPHCAGRWRPASRRGRSRPGRPRSSAGSAATTCRRSCIRRSRRTGSYGACARRAWRRARA